MMRATGWASSCLISLAILAVTVGESTPGSTPGICLAREWQEVESESIQWPICVETRWNKTSRTSEGVHVTASTISNASSSTANPTTDDQELDADSPLDNANFLSFEDWRQQNLAKAGQSADNVRGNRRGGAADRRRPMGISDALDSLGEDAEIELDFSGFGTDTPDGTKPPSFSPGADARETFDAVGGKGGADVDSPAPGIPRAGASRRKDAGTTCKERFNYASFDCAATVLKTNPECQGASSVLIENKDSYMLNECRANNKFLILELCDDILVDTVALANYEFFSSIFRTFRVSVSDRYPAKPDQWKELGVFEARNTREVQAFAVENPLIWARYLRIEFLTHYGHEYYCPLSLIRIHGTTMLEEYKHDGEVGRVEDDIAEESLEPSHMIVDLEPEDASDSPAGVEAEPGLDYEQHMESPAQEICLNLDLEIENYLVQGHSRFFDMCGVHAMPARAAGRDGVNHTVQYRRPSGDITPSSKDDSTSVAPGPDASNKEATHIQNASKQTGVDVGSSSISSSMTMSETAQHDATSDIDIKTTTFAEYVASIESTKPTLTQPPSSNPTTQESFFRSVNKRLQMLEANSTLSLLYIEEQSRILRDAFSKVEKRQLAKTSAFLESLNATVLNELRQFGEQYDQVWKTVVLEFEHQRIQYHKELHSLSAQLGVLADELVFQKRVAVIQSIMVLFCFGLILFSRGAASNSMEFPSVQNMVSRSYSLRSSSPIFGSSSSPNMSPDLTRPTTSYHRRNLSEDSQDRSPSPAIAYSPPTPTSEASSPSEVQEKRVCSPLINPLRMPDIDPYFRSQSSPPVLEGGEDGDVGLVSSESAES